MKGGVSLISSKNLKAFNLTDKQMKIYKEYEEKEQLLRQTLKKCNILTNAIEPIIYKTDVLNIDLQSIDLLEESIKQTWADFIVNKS